MERANKEQVVAEITEAFANVMSVVMADFRGVDVETVGAIRRDCRANGLQYRVLKNSLVKIAVKDNPKLAAMSVLLKGPTALLWSNDSPSAAAKLALAAGGRKVLLVEVEGRQGIAQLFDVPPLPYEERRVAVAPDGGEVYALAIDAEAAMIEYLELFYKLGRAGGALRKLGAVEFADHHDAVHEVGTGHQRGVQNGRHPPDDLVAGEGSQHENVEGDETGQRDGQIHGLFLRQSRQLSWLLRS